MSGYSSTGGTITPVERTLVIHEPTSHNEVGWYGYSGGFFGSITTKRVATIKSNNKGFFQVELPPGKYSFFVVEDSLYYANLFDGQDHILPATVMEDSVTKLTIDITYKAAY